VSHGSRQFSLAYLTVLGTPPRQMIEIAAETGYDFVSLRLAPVTPEELRFPFTTDPWLVADVINALDDCGISLLDVELIRTDPGTNVVDFAAFAEVAAEMGARHIVTQIPEPDRGRAVERFQEVCELADGFGMTADLEFIPWSPTGDLGAAAEIVMRAARPNGGILVDTLHFARSHSSVAQLADLPTEMFNLVQLCDARAPVSDSADELIRVARSDREPPGDGEIELELIVDTLPTVPYALEVPNEAMREKLGALEFSRLLLEKTMRFFDAVDADPAAAAG
jgi:sugar phosphate isomerase/epimerase